MQARGKGLMEGYHSSPSCSAFLESALLLNDGNFLEPKLASVL